MLAFPEMLVPCAKEAGIAVPKNIDKYSKDKFPHWHIFCAIQLGAALPTPHAHWDNAKVIAAIPQDKIKKVTLADLIGLGLSIST